MSLEILEKVEIRHEGHYVKVRVSDGQDLLDFKFGTVDIIVDVVPPPQTDEEEKLAIKGVCMNLGYTYLEKEIVRKAEENEEEDKEEPEKKEKETEGKAVSSDVEGDHKQGFYTRRRSLWSA